MATLPMDTAMPQSNPQSDIQNILMDVSPSLPNTPIKKSNRKNTILITLAVILGIGIIVYAIVSMAPKNTGLTQQEKMEILNYLEQETVPVALPVAEKASIVEKLQERASTQ